MRMHPLVALARTHLAHPLVSFEPAPEKLRLAAVYTGIGIDHLAGEEPVVLVDESATAQIGGAVASFFDENFAADHWDGALVTTQRFILGALEAVAMPLAGIQAARVKGTILKDVEVAAVDERGGRIHKAHPLETHRELVAFLSALAQVPPQARAIPPRAADLITQSAEDPSGALLALGELRPVSDLRAVVMLRAIGVAAGTLGAEASGDLARRAALFERNERCGRGMRGGMWLSPLSVEDFETLCFMELGQPIHRFVDPSGCLVLGFRYDSSLAAAAASSAAGYASAQIIGIGWSEKPVRTLVDVRLVRFGSITGFSLRAASGDRFTILPRGADLGFVQASHAMIAWHEARALLFRILAGWSLPLHELMATPPAVVEQRVQELLGPTDLSPFANPPERPRDR
jgi:hypothetical protein